MFSLFYSKPTSQQQIQLQSNDFCYQVAQCPASNPSHCEYMPAHLPCLPHHFFKEKLRDGIFEKCKKKLLRLLRGMFSGLLFSWVRNGSHYINPPPPQSSTTRKPTPSEAWTDSDVFWLKFIHCCQDISSRKGCALDLEANVSSNTFGT